MKDDLNGLDKAVSAVLGERTIERNLLLVKVAKSKLAKRHDDKNEKLTKPEELVRLYDLLLQVDIHFFWTCINWTNISLHKDLPVRCIFLYDMLLKFEWQCSHIWQNTADLSDLVNSGRDKKPEEVSFAEVCSYKSLAFRAQRFASWRKYCLIILRNFVNCLLNVHTLMVFSVFFFKAMFQIYILKKTCTNNMYGILQKKVHQDTNYCSPKEPCCSSLLNLGWV